jgi:selenocysteine lyase/cysteine desulfurase
MDKGALPCQRHLFDLADDVSYLNCSYQGPQLKRSTELAARELRRKGRPWSISAEDFFVPAEVLREQFAGLIGAAADDIAIVPSLSYAMATAASCLPVNEDQHVVMLSEQFPSHVYPWTEPVSGARRVTTVERPAEGDWTQKVIRAIDPACAVAALPESHWTDGYRLRLDEISRHCRANGTALALDLTQSLGAAPFSIGEVEADFAAASVYKWMLGPPGLCLMYVHPRHQNKRPLEPNWISRRDSQNFAGLTDYTGEFQPGARRYDAGGRAHLVNMAVANSALEQIHAWGVANINRTIASLTNRAADLAGERGLECTPPDHRARHMIGIRLPAGATGRLAHELHERRVYVSLRGDKLRISPHVYNSTEDIDRLFSALDSILS